MDDNYPYHDHVHEGERIEPHEEYSHTHLHVHEGAKHIHPHKHAKLPILTKKGNLQDNLPVDV